MARKKPRERGRRGAGSVYQRKDGQWVAQLSVTVNGARERVTRLAPTQPDAQAALDALKREQAVPAATGPLTLADWTRAWLARVKPSLAASTHDRYTETAEKVLLPRLGLLPLRKLTVQSVDDLARSDHTADARHKALKLLRQLLKAALKDGRVTSNPAELVPLPKVPREVIHPLTTGEVGDLLAWPRYVPFLDLIALALDTGARQGELFALTWADVDVPGLRVRINKTLSEVRGHLAVKEPKTKAGRRTVDIDARTMGRLLHFRRGDGLVFCGGRGGHLRKSNFTRNHYRPVMDSLGHLDVTFHDLRHTCATLLLQSNTPAKVVSERLGHSTIVITLDTYSHVLPTMQQSATAALGKILYG